MHIKSIIVDGFKSYAQRTEVNGFDPQFNAITGLNGSGKSNILDAICFLLGITNLSQVRATNLQDLVYKSGQAGIIKATVSIVFDNQDKTQSPYGYEQFDELTITRQIVVGGRNKYLINGTNATNTRVQDLFHSVQLNVNNPHFLIMQGRITKVLNMKPPEILSLLEEAASTKLYEHKKEAALKTIEKKDNKLREIDKILGEDINPTLNKLRQERSSYMEYQKVGRELEHLQKFSVAFQFKCLQEVKQRTNDELEEMQRSLEKSKEDVKKLESGKVDMEKEIANLAQEKAQHSGEALTTLENDFAEKQKQDAVAQGAKKRAGEAVRAAQQRVKALAKQRNETENLLRQKEKEVGGLQNSFDGLQNRAEQDARNLEAAQKHLQAVLSGLASNEDGAAATLEEQLRVAEHERSAAATEQRQLDMRQQHLAKDLANQEAALKRTNQNFGQEETTKNKLVAQLKSLETQMTKSGYNEGREAELSESEVKLTRDWHALRSRVDGMAGRFPNLQFDYADPAPNFDRNRVKGLVANLFTVVDPKFATALEVTAGGKLYNVIVDTELTAKLLVDRGQLRRRVTVLPLNQMRGHVVPDHVLRKAQSIVGQDNVATALSLVKFAPELRPAMEYVFGGVLVCPDLDTAKRVAFHPEVERRTVTLEGDVFDPQGTLTGGSRSHGGSLLLRLDEWRSAESELVNAEHALTDVRQELAQLRAKAEGWTQLARNADQVRHEVAMLDQRLAQTDYHRILADVNNLKAEIDNIKAQLKAVAERATKAERKVASVRDKLTNVAAVREREQRAADDAVAKARKAVETSSAQLRDQQAGYDVLRLETEELQKELEAMKTQVTEADAGVESTRGEETRQSELAAAAHKQLEEARSALTNQRQRIDQLARLIGGRELEYKKLSQELSQTTVQSDQLQHRIQMQIKESKDADQKLEYLLSKNPWIPDEEHHFGEPNTPYDFSQADHKDVQRRIGKLAERRDKLSRTVNMRAMNMLGTAEKQYEDLVKRQAIVLSDKRKIQDVIDDLDRRKSEILLSAYQKVNEELCSIFSTLLPGAKARLVPPEGQTVLDGLEFRVAFGDVWKESLSELSGGQRSLVALSLILALLRFKPAPLYILDEVDAALDISHTQNIGQLIKNHFHNAQFVVVSLKDGMFNNANVLFKTSFVDGVSAVSRHVPQHHQKALPMGGPDDGARRKR